MNIRKIIKLFLVSLVLGLGLSIAQPVRGQTNNLFLSLFQYAVFYDGLMEFSDCATLTIAGPVYCNSNIYLGTPSGSTLTFNYLVSSAGTFTSPPNAGLRSNTWTGTTTYNGTPTPGWHTGAPPLILPTGSTPNSMGSIIQLPDSDDSPSNAVSLQRYFYKAGLVILVTNFNTAISGTNTNTVTTVILKNSMFDATPLIVSYTNNMPVNSTNAAISNAVYQMNTNWAWFGAGNWLSTNASFYDARQQQTNLVTQIDVGRFGAWIATNTNCMAKWNSNTPFNGIIYVADSRATNAQYMDCVRLTNGQTIPPLGTSNTPSYLKSEGLTVATINPLYIAGLYNCPLSANIGSSNTSGTSPCSVVCDALTLLSPAWQDSNSWAEVTTNGPLPVASSSDTVNTAIIAGNVPSTGSGFTQYSGGVHNLVRLLENWSGDTLWLNTSLINLYPSAQATAQFQQPSAYYKAPTRKFSYNLNYQDSSGLPPGTPLFSNAPGAVILTNLTQVYTGGYLYPTGYTVPAGLGFYLNFSPLAYPPIYPGSYPVTATIYNVSYVGMTNGIFTISKASAGVSITKLSQTYSGGGSSVSVTTVPAGLNVNVTYNGSTNAPTNAGSYTVVATVNDTNYQGSATNTLVITPPVPTPITLGGSTILANGTFQLSFTNTPGASFSVLGSADPTAPVADWTVLGNAVEVSPGQFQFIDIEATNQSLQFYMISSP